MIDQLHDLHAKRHADGGKLVIVSNRLPVTIEETEAGPSFKTSNGGLATGLSSLELGDDAVWVGWPGPVSRQNHKLVTEHLQAMNRCVPVFLSERLVERYYEGYSNRTLWPLLHSFQSYAKYSETEFQAYQEANEKFLQTLDGVISAGDTVWIHDYQLMLLPGLLRQRYPGITIGFFLHIPFPAFDVFRLLPQHRTILQSLLSCDLIGFHTIDYVRAFLSSVHRAFGLTDRLGQIMCGDRVVRTITHPMGIDFERFSGHAANATGNSIGDDLNSMDAGTKVVFSMSRLDYTKGIPQALAAFELLLERRPDLHRKAVFIVCVVPSRERVERYKQLKREIDETVGRINSRFGSVDWTPIRYLYRTLDFDEMISLYRTSHVALVTPLRDGLNLVAKEFVAARNDERGVLILSEMAGASKELVESLLVNPNSKEDLRDVLERALDMSPSEQTTRMKALRDRVVENPVGGWCSSFVGKMRIVANETVRQKKRTLSYDELLRIAAQAVSAKRKLFVLDYDGTLTPLVPKPSLAVPDDELAERLGALCSLPDSDVVVASGRRKEDLDSWLGSLPVTLVAEHGAWIRRKGSSKWIDLAKDRATDWKPDVRAALEDFVESIPGSWIEEKKYSLVWHYRRSEPESADLAAKDLVYHLVGIMGEHPVRVVPGAKSIEIRSIHSGKGSCIQAQFDVGAYDFVLAAGDDLTDEDLFASMPSNSITVKVGAGFSKASHRARDHFELRRVLRTIAEMHSNESRAQAEVRS